MQAPAKRTFRIGDTLVLVAATGIGIAGCRYWISFGPSEWAMLWKSSIAGESRAAWNLLQRSIPLASMLLLAWSVAILLLRSFPPRPRWRRLWRQPGFLAIAAAIAAFAWNASQVWLAYAIDDLRVWADPRLHQMLDDRLDAHSLMLHSLQFIRPTDSGGAILLAWLITRASGRWRPEPDWIDRSGRALGIAWICLSLLAATTWLSFH